LAACICDFVEVFWGIGTQEPKPIFHISELFGLCHSHHPRARASASNDARLNSLHATRDTRRTEPTAPTTNTAKIAAIAQSIDTPYIEEMRPGPRRASAREPRRRLPNRTRPPLETERATRDNPINGPGARKVLQTARPARPHKIRVRDTRVNTLDTPRPSHRVSN